MLDSIDKPRKPLGLRKPAIALAISVGAVVVGSAVCLPGSCGCASWIGLEVKDPWGTPFIFLTLFGMLGAAVSTIWLIVSGIRHALRRNR
jgi:hypothetical protein